MITSFPLKMKRYPACVGHRTVAELSTRLNCPLQKNTRVVLHCILHGSRDRNWLGIRSSAKLSPASRLVQIQLDYVRQMLCRLRTKSSCHMRE